MGSPGWVAPERLTGGPAIPASDVFAWGCLVAFASTGYHPFGSGERRGRDAPHPAGGAPDRGRAQAALGHRQRRPAQEPAERPDAAELLSALLAAGGCGLPPNARVAVAEVMEEIWQPVPYPRPRRGEGGPRGPSPSPRRVRGAAGAPPVRFGHPARRLRRPGHGDHRGLHGRGGHEFPCGRRPDRRAAGGGADGRAAQRGGRSPEVLGTSRPPLEGEVPPGGETSPEVTVTTTRTITPTWPQSARTRGARPSRRPRRGEGWTQGPPDNPRPTATPTRTQTQRPTPTGGITTEPQWGDEESPAAVGEPVAVPFAEPLAVAFPVTLAVRRVRASQSHSGSTPAWWRSNRPPRGGRSPGGEHVAGAGLAEVGGEEHPDDFFAGPRTAARPTCPGRRRPGGRATSRLTVRSL